jgi:hypothetical protein
MTDRETRTLAVARRLWDAAAAGTADPDQIDGVIESLLTALDAGLRRWIGAEGYAALLSRSVVDTLPAHPALASISDLGAGDANGEGLPSFEETARREAIMALLSGMMRQLGGIIGDNMAIRLFEQSGQPSPRGVAGVEHNESPS